MTFPPENRTCTRRKRRPMMREVSKLLLDLFRARIRRDVEVLRFMAEQEISHAAANEVRLVPSPSEALNHLDRILIDAASRQDAIVNGGRWTRRGRALARRRGTNVRYDVGRQIVRAIERCAEFVFGFVPVATRTTPRLRARLVRRGGARRWAPRAAPRFRWCRFVAGFFVAPRRATLRGARLGSGGTARCLRGSGFRAPRCVLRRRALGTRRTARGRTTGRRFLGRAVRPGV